MPTGIHRLHHRHADSARDPHKSHRGFLWAHILWTVTASPADQAIDQVTRDLKREPILRWLERHFVAVNALFALALFGIGWLLDGAPMAISLLVWGFFLRIVYGWHVTFLVNSVSHRWGYRNYASRDNSRNCWWVALLSFGEGWHNNHHHQPRCAAHGRRWFEIDETYWVIRLLERVGLAHAVVHARPHSAPGAAVPGTWGGAHPLNDGARYVGAVVEPSLATMQRVRSAVARFSARTRSSSGTSVKSITSPATVLAVAPGLLLPAAMAD